MFIVADLVSLRTVIWELYFMHFILMGHSIELKWAPTGSKYCYYIVGLKDKYLPLILFILFCVDALHLSQQFFSRIGTFCLGWWNKYKSED